MESYISTRMVGLSVASVGRGSTDNNVATGKQDTLMRLVERLTERIEALEQQQTQWRDIEEYARPELSVPAAVSSVAMQCEQRGYQLDGKVDGVDTSFLLDTGAAYTLIRNDGWERIAAENSRDLEQWTGQRIVGANGSPLRVHGTTRVNLSLAGEDTSARLLVVSPLNTEAILGMDFLKEHRATIDLGNEELHLGGRGCAIPLQNLAVSTVGAVGINTVEEKNQPCGGMVMAGAGADDDDTPGMEVRSLRTKKPRKRRSPGKHFKAGMLVCLHSSDIVPGSNAITFRVVRRISDVIYRIQNVNARRQRLVVHFDHLKPCPPYRRLPTVTNTTPQPSQPEPQPPPPGNNLKQTQWIMQYNTLSMPDQPLPTYYQAVIIHKNMDVFEYGTYSLKRGAM